MKLHSLTAGHPRRVCDISLANRGLTPATLLFWVFLYTRVSTCICIRLHHFSNRGESRTVHGCDVVLDLILMRWFVSSIAGKNKCACTHAHTHTLVQTFNRGHLFSPGILHPTVDIHFRVFAYHMDFLCVCV